MKALLLSATAALLLGTAPATASVITLGGSNAESCYRAAAAGDRRPQARSECDRALATGVLSHHDMVGTYVNRGILWMLAGDLARANFDFDEAIRLNPNVPHAWLNKAIAQLNGGNSAVALPLVERAIALRSESRALAYYVRGIAHEETGNLDAAYADLRAAVSLAPHWKAPAVELARYRVRRR